MFGHQGFPVILLSGSDGPYDQVFEVGAPVDDIVWLCSVSVYKIISHQWERFDHTYPEN